MGESFKLHAHALHGFEDSIVAGAEQSQEPPVQTLAPHATEVTAY